MKYSLYEPDMKLALENAISHFPPSYYKDFVSLQPHVDRHLEHRTNVNYAFELASALRTVSINWGAGKRAAARVASTQDIVQALLDPKLLEAVTLLRSVSISNLKVGKYNKAVILRSNLDLDALKVQLLWAIRFIAKTMFIRATTMVYPSKVLLLLTGFSVAVDDKVRKSLKAIGLPGFYTTLELPSSTTDSSFEKFLALHFVLGDFYADNRESIDKALAEIISEYPVLKELELYEGRLFDILLWTGLFHFDVQDLPLDWSRHMLN